ncbi:MAG: OmpA family protein [Zoogloeaceae bacterium]|jgi:outer membrane protein OmpA-like peptidoglycan-associated protein|nr:OmpA family protein [Zoogloeaceae bacterium]
MSLFRRSSVKAPRQSEAVQPFWISFSDLMTALMALFLVAMSVALLAITHEISQTEDQKASREEDIDQFMATLTAATAAFPGVSVRGRVVDFGDRARFETNSHQLNPEQAHLLRAVTPQILALSQNPLGKKWLKRIVVEGFADARGSYLYNLNLSLQRSERLLCVLLAANAPDALSAEERLMVRDLFLVSGSSFNALKASQEESRRIELRLEFLELGEGRQASHTLPLEAEPRCPLDIR